MPSESSGPKEYWFYFESGSGQVKEALDREHAIWTGNAEGYIVLRGSCEIDPKTPTLVKCSPGSIVYHEIYSSGDHNMHVGQLLLRTSLGDEDYVRCGEVFVSRESYDTSEAVDIRVDLSDIRSCALEDLDATRVGLDLLKQVAKEEKLL